MNKRFLAILLLVLVLTGTGFTYAAPSLPGTVSAAMAAVNFQVDGEASIVKVLSDIEIAAGETVNGDVVGVLGDVTVDGEVNGDVVAVLGDVKINHIVRGDVISVLGRITKGPNAQILGQIIETNRPGGLNLPQIEHLPFRNMPFRFGWGYRLFNLVLLFGLAALTLALLPDNVRSMSAALGRDPGRKLLVGFIAILLVPVLFFLTAISLIGIPLIPFIVLAIVIGKFIGYVAVAMFVGSRLRQTGGLHTGTFLELFLGILLLWLVTLVPVFGWLSGLVVTMIALGLVLDTKFGTHNPWFRRREAAPPPPARPADPPIITPPAEVPPAEEDQP